MKEEKYNYACNCLKKHRRINRYSQKQVAVRLGIKNSSMISCWENGHRLPTSLNMFKLAVLYQTSVDSLYIDLIRSIRKETAQKIHGEE